MNGNNRSIDDLEKFYLDLQTLALEYPHTAVTSKSTQYKTEFFNVYFKQEVEDYIAASLLHPDLAYLLVAKLLQDGLVVKLIPLTKHGYTQCTISRLSSEANGYVQVLTGEAGKMYKAIMCAFAKHILILRDAGEGETYWHGRKQNTIEGDGFR